MTNGSEEGFSFTPRKSDEEDVEATFKTPIRPTPLQEFQGALEVLQSTNGIGSEGTKNVMLAIIPNIKAMMDELESLELDDSIQENILMIMSGLLAMKPIDRDKTIESMKTWANASDAGEFRVNTE